jgi:cell division septation protein DedD
MYIEELIGDLLLRHNCVVIPTFGGFVAGQTPAIFDAHKGTITPTRKSLLFNKQLINNDGLLIAAYAHATKKSYEESNDYIQKQIQHWHHKLDAGERISIDRVGFIFLDSERNLAFEQDRFHNLLLAAYGLGKVHFVSQEDIQLIAQQEIFTLSGEPILEPLDIAPIIDLPTSTTEEEEKEFELDEKHPIRTLNSKKLWKYAVAAALLPVCFYTYWIPMKTKVLESGIISIQDFNPFHLSSDGLYKKEILDLRITQKIGESELDQILKSLPKDVEVFSYPVDSDLYVPVKIKEHTVPKTAINTSPTISKPLPTPVKSNSIGSTTNNTSISKSGHLIVGCFSTEQNANKLITTLKQKGFNAYIVDIKNGLHRVSACKSTSDSVLNSAKEKLSPLQISGWILHD